MKITTSICLFLSLVLADSCGENPAREEAFPTDTTWELEYISGPRIAFEGLFPDKKPQLSFDASTGVAAGNSGCNGYSAPYTVDGGTISFGEPGPSTMMYCGEGENVFRNTLQKVNGWNVDADGKLNLLIGEVPMMRFKQSAP